MKAEKKYFTFFVVFISTVFIVNAQNKGESTIPAEPSKPDVKINVNRELDKDGNVVRYDSTYSWSWSSDGSQPVPSEFFNDTNHTDFFRQFDNQSFFGDDSFGFFNDTMINRQFQNPDINMLQKQMMELMEQQQKMMQEFFGQPPTIQPSEENKNQKKIPEAKKTSGGIDI